jgi:hypothetical protein
MPSFRLELDHDGIAEVLKSQDMAEMVDAATEKIAADVQSVVGDMPVTTDSYVTDRAAGSVVIEDVRGMVEQAEHGVLTKAAAAAGAHIGTHKKKEPRG